jgi:hypothetical protein
MRNATERTIKETTYWLPRHPTGEVLEKTVFYSKAGSRFAVSATIRNNLPGTYVRYWHLADIHIDKPPLSTDLAE